MKTYLACLFLIGSIEISVPMSVAVAAPKIGNSIATKIISPAAALHRLIVAEKLEASWFTPEFLKAVDKTSNVNTVQFQRDLMMKLGRMRYGNYKSVQPIGKDKYRIIFDRAEPDAVIAQFKIDASGRIVGVGIAEKNKPEPPASAQAAAQVALNNSLKNNIGSNGNYQPIFASIKQWLGNYQKIQKVDATNYIGIFERGSIDISINFKPDGSIENYQLGCPTTKSLSLNQAPASIQKMFANCPNLQ